MACHVLNPQHQHARPIARLHADCVLLAGHSRASTQIASSSPANRASARGVGPVSCPRGPGQRSNPRGLMRRPGRAQICRPHLRGTTVGGGYRRFPQAAHRTRTPARSSCQAANGPLLPLRGRRGPTGRNPQDNKVTTGHTPTRPPPPRRGHVSQEGRALQGCQAQGLASPPHTKAGQGRHKATDPEVSGNPGRIFLLDTRK